MEETSEDEQLARALALSLEGVNPGNLIMQHDNQTNKALPQVPSTTKSVREWYPNVDILHILLSMGISENAAKRGLYNTGNTNADVAAAWVFENLENPDLHKPFSPPLLVMEKQEDIDVKGIQASLDESRAFKMVFVVNMSLGMGIGKVAAQVGHATLALYKSLLINVSEQQNVREWEEKGAKKIVLKGSSTEQLFLLKEKAQRLSIPSFLIKDAGKTQIQPGSVTVLGLFGKGYMVDEITGSLTLL